MCGFDSKGPGTLSGWGKPQPITQPPRIGQTHSTVIEHGKNNRRRLVTSKVGVRQRRNIVSPRYLASLPSVINHREGLVKSSLWFPHPTTCLELAEEKGEEEAKKTKDSKWGFATGAGTEWGFDTGASKDSDFSFVRNAGSDEDPGFELDTPENEQKAKERKAKWKDKHNDKHCGSNGASGGIGGGGSSGGAGGVTHGGTSGGAGLGGGSASVLGTF